MKNLNKRTLATEYNELRSKYNHIVKSQLFYKTEISKYINHKNDSIAMGPVYEENDIPVYIDYIRMIDLLASNKETLNIISSKLKRLKYKMRYLDHCLNLPPTSEYYNNIIKCISQI